MLLVAGCFICCGVNLWFSYYKKNSQAGFFKILASVCLILFAWTLDLFTTSPWFVTGLLLCGLGDFWLTYKGKGVAFMIGLMSFLFAHLCYSLAFIGMGIDSGLLPITGTITLTLTAAIAWWLLKGLSSTYKKLVTSYLLVIAIMVCLSWSVSSKGLLLGLGASLFAISDIFVAINRFKQPAFFYRLIGLPTYYLAQFLLALGFYKVL